MLQGFLESSYLCAVSKVWRFPFAVDFVVASKRPCANPPYRIHVITPAKDRNREVRCSKLSSKGTCYAEGWASNNGNIYLRLAVRVTFFHGKIPFDIRWKKHSAWDSVVRYQGQNLVRDDGNRFFQNGLFLRIFHTCEHSTVLISEAFNAYLAFFAGLKKYAA